MAPGDGYWLKANMTDVLIYPRLPVMSGMSASLASPAEAVAPQSPVIPTTEWINVWGDSIMWGNELIEIGAVIQAMDPDSVVCGEFIVQSEGCFGLMTVYGDDPYTSEDEGAEPGDEIKFFINTTTANTSIVWTAGGDVVDYHLLGTGIEDKKLQLPTHYSLSQNYPNPFNPVTSILYELPEAAIVSLNVYNVDGLLVRKLVNEKQTPDRYTVKWDGRNESDQVVSSGIYFYRIKANNFTQTRKMIFLK